MPHAQGALSAERDNFNFIKWDYSSEKIDAAEIYLLHKVSFIGNSQISLNKSRRLVQVAWKKPLHNVCNDVTIEVDYTIQLFDSNMSRSSNSKQMYASRVCYQKGILVILLCTFV